MPIGTEYLRRIRDGPNYSETKKKSNERLRISEKCADDGNYIKIQHSDKTSCSVCFI